MPLYWTWKKTNGPHLKNIYYGHSYVCYEEIIWYCLEIIYYSSLIDDHLEDASIDKFSRLKSTTVAACSVQDLMSQDIRI